MIKEEKELLIRDLCGRLPYGVQGITSEGVISPLITKGEADWDILTSLNYRIVKHGWKPYLRPMSSMTEEEKDYIKNVARFKQSDGIHYDDGVHYVPIYQETLDDQWKTDGKFPPILGDIYRFMLDYGYILLIDFFNSHHIDYRGLIEKGLALEAPEGMYNTKTE